MEAEFVSGNDEASYPRIRARERAIEAAARACRDDGRALATFGIFMWALANRGDIAATERISMVMFKGERLRRAELFDQK